MSNGKPLIKLIGKLVLKLSFFTSFDNRMRANSWNNPIHVGMTFIFRGDYCTVIKKKYNHFQYSIQGSTVNGYMTYDFYKTTPSFKGRQPKKI